MSSVCKIFVCLLVVLGAPVALALPEEIGTIEFLQVHHNPSGTGDEYERYFLKLADSTISENNCGSDKWTGYLSGDSDKAAYSTLLALFMAGKPVRVQGTNADTCVGDGVLIRNVYPAW